MKINKFFALTFSSLHFQKVLVYPFGGSGLKLFDIASIAFLASAVSKNVRFSKYTLVFIFGSVFSTLPGSILFYSTGVYESFIGFAYSEMGSQADNLFTGPLRTALIWARYLLFTCFLGVLLSTRIASENLCKILKSFVLFSAGVSCYCIYSLLGINLLNAPDIVPNLLDYRNSQPEYLFRSIGFANEPGVLINILGPAFLILTFCTDLFGKYWRITLYSVIGIALIMTISSILVILFFAIFVTACIGLNRLRILRLFISIFLLLGLSYSILALTDYGSTLSYAFYDKYLDFLDFGSSEKIISSGSGVYRGYNVYIGWQVVVENLWFGLGLGNSVYALHLFDERSAQFLQTPLMSGWLQVFAERGLFGGFFQIWALCWLGIKLLSLRRVSGGLGLAALSCFLFVFMGFAVNYPYEAQWAWTGIIIFMPIISANTPPKGQQAAM